MDRRGLYTRRAPADNVKGLRRATNHRDEEPAELRGRRVEQRVLDAPSGTELRAGAEVELGDLR
jgi:hypothetical protein